MATRTLPFFLLLLLLTSPAFAQTAPIGIFDGDSDIGTLLHRGTAEYDKAMQTYTVAGSGENIWEPPDAFQFVWKKVTGDFALTADVAILSSGGHPHRKAVLMLRQSLDADSVYADIALHGEGLTSLQFRDEKGGASHEVRATFAIPSACDW